MSAEQNPIRTSAPSNKSMIFLEKVVRISKLKNFLFTKSKPTKYNAHVLKWHIGWIPVELLNLAICTYRRSPKKLPLGLYFFVQIFSPPAEYAKS